MIGEPVRWHGSSSTFPAIIKGYRNVGGQIWVEIEIETVGFNKHRIVVSPKNLTRLS